MRLTKFVIPCRRLRVEVQYGESEGLSVSEQMLLRSVAAGANTLEALGSLLGLPPRMLLDLCIEMLHGGFLQVERPSGQLQISDAVANAMGDPRQPKKDWPKSFASPSPPTPDDVEILQDCVSGSLFRPPPRHWEPGSFQRAPVDPELPEPAEISKTDLMLAAASSTKERAESSPRPSAAVPGRQRRASSTKERGESSVNDPTGGWAALRAHRVVNVSIKRLERAGSATAGAVDISSASILVTARCFRSTLGAEGEMMEPPRFVIVEPREIPISVRRRIADGLTRLAERGVGTGSNQFFQTLQYDAELVDLEAERTVVHPDAIEGALAAATADLKGAPASAELHARLVEVDEAARDTIDSLSRNRAHVELVTGAAAHYEWAIRALAEAEQQVVLGCPWMGRLGVDSRFTDALIAAAARGVHVHLLWGVSANEAFDANFDDSAHRVIERANRAGHGVGGAVFAPTRPCASHAKLILCDLDWMVVGSSNYLNAPPERKTGELGLQVKRAIVDAAEGDTRPAACMPVADVVAWCRSLLRDFRLRRYVADDPILFGRQGPLGSVAVPQEISEASWGTAFSEQFWRASWQNRLEQHEKLLSSVQSSPGLVFDGDHRHLLFQALAQAKRRLVIASPRLGLGLLGTASLSALHTAVERTGLEIVILHSGEPPAAPQERQRLADERARLRDLISKGLTIRTWDSHAKLLLFDDELAIGSFNYLSFEGYYGDRNQARHELSVRVWSPSLADAIWDQVQRQSAVAPP